MNRRTFLAGGLAAFGAPASGIIDTHTHFYDPARAQGVPWPPKSDELLYRRVLPGEYQRMAAPLGVTGTVVVEASAWLEDNQWILDLAKDSPIIRGFVGHLEPGQPAFREQLARFSKNPLFRGIRVNARGLREVDDLKRLAGAGLSLDVLVGADLLPEVARLAAAVTDLRIVVDHLPLDGGPPLPAMPPNVFAKVSGALRPEWMDSVWSTFGPDRLLYASNWPVSERAAPFASRLRVVREYFMAKPGDAAGKFFSANAQAVYKIR